MMQLHNSSSILIGTFINDPRWVRNMGICKLFDRGDYGVEIHNESPAKFQNNSLVLLKLSSKYDNCTTLEESRKTDVDNNVNVSAIHKFEKCAPRIGRTKTYASQYSNTTRILPNDSEFAALPKLHIVVFVTESWLVNKKTEVDIIASHWSCYAKAHDYLFSLVSLPTMTVAEFFTRRHQYVLDELLHTAQYIAQMEADSFVINMGVSFERFLSQSQHSIHLQFRENGEVHSGIYILKNDMNSICFLEYWLSFFAPVIPELGPKPSSVPAWPIFIDNPNSDNGALVAAMALLLAKYTDSTDVYMKCLENLHPTRIRVYPEQHCLDILQTKLYYTFGPEAQDPKPGRIRVWWHREGFWRTSLHSRDAPEGRGHEDLMFFENLYKSCYPSSDFIGHGNKLTHLEIEPDQSTSCNIEKVRNATGGGRNPKCKWLSEQEELTLLRKHCQWRSPACMPGGRTTSAPGNNDLNNVCLYIPNENSTDTTTMLRNPNCKQSASTITFVETTG